MFISILLSIISTHYLENIALPLVVKIKSMILGEQIYDNAKNDLNLINFNKWVHPTTLSLKAYGKTQEVLNEYNLLNESLPNYTKHIISEKDLIFISEYFIKNTKRVLIDSTYVRFIDFPINKPIYGITKPWVSGLTQSFIGQTLLAAFKLTGNNKYLIASIEVANLLFLDVISGGVLVKFDEDKYWYEEYAEKSTNPPLVLNGHILALDFLYYLKQIDSNPKWEKMFNHGINALVFKIDSFIGKNWSYYDLNLNYANGKYHRFHIRQLNRYMSLDSTNKLKKAKYKMEKQLLYPFGIFERILFQPSKLLIFLIIIFTISYFILIEFILLIKNSRNK